MNLEDGIGADIMWDWGKTVGSQHVPLALPLNFSSPSASDQLVGPADQFLLASISYWSGACRRYCTGREEEKQWVRKVGLRSWGKDWSGGKA